MTPSSSVSFHSLVRFLYTQNPFYLVGTFLLLFGLQQCLGAEPILASSGTLAGIIAAYTLVIAGIAAVVVRYGQVWDDARTILLVIVLLFFMLAASLDYRLIETPASGTLLLGAGLAFAIGLSECLLRGLRIALAARYRLPYYLLLAVLFAFPAVPAWLGHWGYYDARTWSRFLFPSVAAVALLTLLPAARTAPWREPASGTPWVWPYYPWSLFVFLTIGIAIRAWWLTISFETSKGLYGFFQPYFLLPLVLAWSALILEMGLARWSPGATAAGLALPLAGLALAFPGTGKALDEIAFTDRLLAAAGSPAQLAVASLLVFYAWAWLRKVPAAEGFFLALGMAASVVGPGTLNLDTLGRPQPLVLAGVAGILLIQAIRWESTWRAVLGGAAVLMAARLAGARLDTGGLWFWQWHAPLLGFLVLTAVFNDPLARFLRQAAWRIAPALALSAAIAYPWAIRGLSDFTLGIYLALVLLVSLTLWERQREVATLAAVLATGGANLLNQARHLYLSLEQTVLAAGLPWMAVGLGVVLLALGISLLKMGVWQGARGWLARANLALGGEGPASA